MLLYKEFSSHQTINREEKKKLWSFSLLQTSLSRLRALGAPKWGRGRHTWNPALGEAEAGKPQAQSQPGQPRETLSQTKLLNKANLSHRSSTN